MDYSIALSTKPEKSVDEVEMLEHSTNSFKRAIESKNVAKAMIVISKNNYQDIYFDSRYLQDISNKN